MITIVVQAPARNNGRSTSRLFKARVEAEQRTLCASEQPFLDGARELIERGYDPGELLVMRHEGADEINYWSE
jgi:hypothetical protein